MASYDMNAVVIDGGSPSQALEAETGIKAGTAYGLTETYGPSTIFVEEDLAVSVALIPPWGIRSVSQGESAVVVNEWLDRSIPVQHK